MPCQKCSEEEGKAIQPSLGTPKAVRSTTQAAQNLKFASKIFFKIDAATRALGLDSEQFLSSAANVITCMHASHIKMVREGKQMRTQPERARKAVPHVPKKAGYSPSHHQPQPLLGGWRQS